VYFNDLGKSAEYKTPIENISTTRIQPDDLLSITVSSLNPGSNVLFNSGTLPPSSSTDAAIVNRANEGYLVDKNGFVNLPVIGKIKLGGLSKEEANNLLTNKLTEYLKDPIVNIRFLNFKVTVIGEVNNPSSFTILNEKINVLEALGLAGDMTAFGKRENVLIIREKEGIRSATRINLNNKEVLNSPYFYLQQNDIVYVEPENRTKVAQTSASNRFIPIVVAAITAVAIYISNIR
jgi:polysaccharide export outer membrane protein